MDWRIPRFDYREQYRQMRGEILAAVDQVLDSGSLILGPHVRQFEAAMCGYLGGAGQAVGVGSGTDALAIALRALGIGPGDQVITVANTAVATISAIRMTGAIPVFCDIDPQTLLMSPADAERRISPRTKAILPVHLFGNAVDMKAISRLAAGYGLHVVEDCAQSCGAVVDGRPTGTWGDVGCFSFYPTKNLAAYGDGGLCHTRRPELAESMRQIRFYGCDPDQYAYREGINSRLDEIHAAILEVKLRHLPEFLRKRRDVAEWYRQNLSPKFSIPQIRPGVEHAWHLFVVETEKRPQVIAGLKAAGIGFGIHYPVPIHLMHAYRFLEYREGSLPQTEAAAGRVLSLPCYPELTESNVKEICKVANDALCE
jgi:dTDP-3-amino-2,3,6-trideoxy-4-keto-D-glucose/dTDP-3-amino-3,4,6-trideoxy-alpha-D-glucose/dTDP-2,6-dideoxy-D-kanosamine transaminase